MKKLFGKKDKDEKKTEEKKPAAIKPSISQPINYNPPSKQAIVQPSSTMQITASNTLETANENMEENPQQIDNLPPQTLIEMKKGDYNVHILIENVKNLVPVEENVPIPLVVVGAIPFAFTSIFSLYITIGVSTARFPQVLPLSIE